MSELGQSTSEQPPKDLIGFLDYYLVTKAPVQIPQNAKEWLVTYGPWILIVLLVLTLPVLLVALGLGSVLVPFGGVGYATGFGFLAIGVLVETALNIAALPGLFARQMSGWKLLFYGRLVGILARVLAGAVVSALIVGVLSMYLLFQVRSLYKT